MEIGGFFLFLLALILGVSSVFLISRSIRLSERKLKFIVFSVVFFWILLSASTTTVIVVNSDGSHESKDFWGVPKIMLPNGRKKQLSCMKMFTTYCINLMDEDILIYPVLYGEDANKIEITADDFLEITSHHYSQVSHNPDFYFEEPNSIKVSEDLLESLYNSTIGVRSEKRYVLDTKSNAIKRFEGR